jgi:hypothetical protein
MKATDQSNAMICFTVKYICTESCDCNIITTGMDYGAFDDGQPTGLD